MNRPWIDPDQMNPIGKPFETIDVVVFVLVHIALWCLAFFLALAGKP